MIKYGNYIKILYFMKDSLTSPQPHTVEESKKPNSSRRFWLKRLWGGGLVVLGYLLSPLSWWNDLFFNLPFAYGLGYVASYISPKIFLPAAIAGYWLSNIAGILLMQLGIGEVLQNKTQERNLKKELLAGVASSTLYSLAILGLIYFHILETPNLGLENPAFSLNALLSFGSDR